MGKWMEAAGWMTLSDGVIALRLGLATVLGAILGFERTRKRRAAGMRTYSLVCLGAAAVMMTGQFMAETMGGSDPARLGAQVISGIGFLGAGTILITGVQRIKGLTTAAGLWAAACLGLAVGIGFYVCALVMFGAILFIMTLLNLLQRGYIKKCRDVNLYVVFEGPGDISAFLAALKEQEVRVEEFEMERTGLGIGAYFQIRISRGQSHTQIMEYVSRCRGILMAVED